MEASFFLPKFVLSKPYVNRKAQAQVKAASSVCKVAILEVSGLAQSDYSRIALFLCVITQRECNYATNTRHKDFQK